MIDVETTGGRIPALGFGTWRLEGAAAQSMVEAALGIGYRHVDTAQAYGNEAEVGAGLKAAGLPREEVWLTTKIWPDHFRAGDLERQAEERVRLLGTVPDLLLLHWPNPSVPLAETIGALNRAREQGLTRHIGVSNFSTALLAEAAGLSSAPLVADQVEYHPFLGQRRVLEACRERRTALTAYCPLARGRVFDEPTLGRIAAAHGKTAGQVTLRWLVQQPGVCAIPRTSSEANARANLAIFDFELSSAEMAEIAGLKTPDGRICEMSGLIEAWDPDD